MVATYDEAVEQIAQAVFATMLSMDLVRVDLPAPPDREMLLAVVHIAGHWTGSVVLALSPEFAQQCAVAMLRVVSDEVSVSDEHDVASELVNMVGGNLKSLLPGPSYLSLPTIVCGREFGLQVHDAELLDDLVLAGDRGLLRLRLFAKRCTPL